MSCYPGPKDVGKVWNVLTRNGKGKKKKVVIKDSGVRRKVVPLFIDDDNKVIEREKIINMHNVFVKETNNEYSNEHMDNLFNVLFENKKHYRAQRTGLFSLSPKKQKGNTFYLPSIKSQTPSEKLKSKFLFTKVSDFKPYDDEDKKGECQFDSFDSEIEEKLTPDAFNRNKVVMNLRKEFPFFSTKKEREKEELIHSNIFKSDSKIECRNTQNNLERIYKYKTNTNFYNNKKNHKVLKIELHDPHKKNQHAYKISKVHTKYYNTEGRLSNHIKKVIRTTKSNNPRVIRFEN